MPCKSACPGRKVQPGRPPLKCSMVRRRRDLRAGNADNNERKLSICPSSGSLSSAKPQSRPRAVHGADLEIHETAREASFTHDGLRHVRDHLRGFFRPRNPQPAVVGTSGHLPDTTLELAATLHEPDRQLCSAARRASDCGPWRKRTERGFETFGRTNECDRRAWTNAEFLGERRTGVTGWPRRLDGLNYSALHIGVVSRRPEAFPTGHGFPRKNSALLFPCPRWWCFRDPVICGTAGASRLVLRASARRGCWARVAPRQDVAG